MITGIAGVNTTPVHGVVSFILGRVHGGGKKSPVDDAFVLSRVTTDKPVNPIESNDRRKHLAGLDVSDADFETPA